MEMVGIKGRRRGIEGKWGERGKQREETEES